MASNAYATPNHDVNDDLGLRAFQAEMDSIDKVKSVNAERAAAVKKAQRLSKQREWRQQLKRAQQYLGLPDTKDLAKEESVDRVCSELIDLSLKPEAAKDDSNQAYHSYDYPLPLDHLTSPVVFVSIDVEAYEFVQKFITEIGISTLDTADLRSTLPGSNGNNWAAKIQSSHLRIREHGKRINRVWVLGCPDNFNFGQSEWIYEREIVPELESLFLHLYSNRRVVLVGHDISGDIKYLKGLGFDVLSMVVDCIDTSDLWKAAHRDARQSALSKVLLQQGISAKYLHNAGNDAYYTLHAMIAIAVVSSLNKKTPEDWEVEKNKRIEEAYAIARAKVCADLEGWSSAEDDDSLPVPSSRQHPSINLENEVPTPAVDTYPDRPPSTVSTSGKVTCLKTQSRPEFHNYSSGTLGEIAVQDDPKLQDVSQGPYIPFSSEFAGLQPKTKDAGSDSRVPRPGSYGRAGKRRTGGRGAGGKAGSGTHGVANGKSTGDENGLGYGHGRGGSRARGDGGGSSHGRGGSDRGRGRGRRRAGHSDPSHQQQPTSDAAVSP
ncbi:hypothetical protein IMSHALPRED_006133 [Imshaugia aleurites]|uniref:Gfd2/YDR514C-like C-terminal domain-containing protein n=1 Tax=Imshaugia aleurites TaxID=172621 RepID=A0A8H3IDM4_9LECA|nr:hypothetical protein IMSHALPRED_006133 [Imshaugia aleurites]